MEKNKAVCVGCGDFRQVCCGLRMTGGIEWDEETTYCADCCPNQEEHEEVRKYGVYYSLLSKGPCKRCYGKQVTEKPDPQYGG